MKEMTVAVLIAVSMLIMTDCYAAGGFESNIYQKIEDFTWKEFDEDGERLLEESGSIYGLCFAGLGKIPLSRANGIHLLLKGKIEIFGGTVDYDGQTQGGVPITSDVDYFGIKSELTVGPGFTLPRKSDSFFVQFGPFIGLGVRFWERDIDDTTYWDSYDGDEVYVYGYTESWTCTYAPVGIRGDFVFPKPSIKVFSELAVKMPLNNTNSVDNFPGAEGEKIEVEPGKEFSTYFELGIAWQKSRYPGIKASFFYENMRFSRSDWTYSEDDSFRVCQPESKADTLGLHIGVVF